MNGHGQQVLSVCSLRPLPGAPVATPLAWDEVDEELDPSAFTPEVVLERAEHGDLFAPAPSGRHRLDEALARL